jgi:hypothetical protein
MLGDGLTRFLQWTAIFVAYAFAILLLLSAGVAISSHSQYSANHECLQEYLSFSLCLLSFVWGWVGEHFDAVTTALTALATAFIAWFTFALFSATRQLKGSTDKLWNAAEKQMEEMRPSIQAATDSANTAKSSLELIGAQVEMAEASVEVAHMATDVAIESAKATAIAANAAMLQVQELRRSVDASRLAERAYIKMSHLSGSPTYGQSALRFHDGGMGRIKVRIKNHGRTPGTVLKVLLTYEIVDKGAEPPERTSYEGPNAQKYVGAFLVADDEYTIEHDFPRCGAGDLIDVERGKRRYWVLGYVDYRDQFGRIHRGGYGRVFTGDTVGNNLGFEESDLNYDEREE